MIDFFDMLLGTTMYYIEKYGNVLVVAMVINLIIQFIGGSNG